MQPVNKPIPKIVVQSIGGGLLLMAFFTTMWSAIAQSALTGINSIIVLLGFGILSLIFIGYGIYLFIRSKHFTKLKTGADKAEGKRIGVWYGIIFGAEGITIPAVVFTLIHFRHNKLILPAIAMVVGLHFYPMAKVFNRTIDYYLATWTCVVALIAIALTVYNILPQHSVFALLGIGVAMATSGYGLYMMYVGNGLVRKP